MRITLIHNPKAGKGKPTRDELLEALQKHGHEPRYQSSKEKGWSRCLDDRTDLFVVAGGDGTVARVAKKLAGRSTSGIPIAVLPLGTANNVAESLGVRGTFQDLIEGWSPARRVSIDVGDAVVGDKAKAFIESVGCGFFSDMMARVDTEESDIDGRTPHEALAKAREILRETLATAGPSGWKVELDGQDYSGSYLLVEAMNMRRIGPGLELAPDANMDDGLLEVVFVCDNDSDRADLDAHLREHPADQPAPPLLKIRRVREVVLDAKKHVLHLDDKSWSPAGPVHLTVGRRKLTFLAP